MAELTEDQAAEQLVQVWQRTLAGLADGTLSPQHRAFLRLTRPMAVVGDPTLGDGLSAKKLMTAVEDGGTKGASIKLNPVRSVLGLTEGMETALAVMAATGQHVGRRAAPGA